VPFVLELKRSRSLLCRRGICHGAEAMADMEASIKAKESELEVLRNQIMLAKQDVATLEEQAASVSCDIEKLKEMKAQADMIMNKPPLVAPKVVEEEVVKTSCQPPVSTDSAEGQSSECKPVLLGEKTTSVMSSIDEEQEKLSEARVHVTKTSQKLHRQALQDEDQSRKLLNKKMDKTKVADMTEEERGRILELTWDLQYFKGSGMQRERVDSDISKLTEEEFATDLTQAIANYEQNRKVKKDIEEDPDRAHLCNWVHPEIEQIIEFVPQPELVAQGSSKPFYRAYALVQFKTVEQARQLSEDYVHHPSIWPILRLRGQWVPEARMPPVGFLMSRLKALSSAGSSKPKSNASNKSGYLAAEDFKKQREAEKTKREAEQLVREKQKEAQRQKQELREKFRRSLVRVSGIPSDKWDSTSQIDAIKSDIKALVNKMAQTVAAPQEFEFQVSFSNPTQARRGSAWVTFRGKGGAELTTNMSEWFANAVQDLRTKTRYEELPFPSLQADPWKGNDGFFRV